MTKEEIRVNNRVYSKRYRQKHVEKIRLYEKEVRPKSGLRAKLMVFLRELKGNKCSLCGYCEQPKILHFHHLRDKKFSVSDHGHSRQVTIEEAEKCILLCPNCHALTHLKYN